MSENSNKAITGGEFLIRDVHASEIFIPEEWSEEQRMIKQTCEDFIPNIGIPEVSDVMTINAVLYDDTEFVAKPVGFTIISRRIKFKLEIQLVHPLRRDRFIQVNGQPDVIPFRPYSNRIPEIKIFVIHRGGYNFINGIN